MRSETESPFELIDADPAIISFAREHTTCRQAAEDVMALGPLRTGLTAGQPEVVLAHADHVRDLAAECVQATDLSGRSRQAVRGVGPGRRL